MQYQNKLDEDLTLHWEANEGAAFWLDIVKAMLLVVQFSQDIAGDMVLI